MPDGNPRGEPEKKESGLFISRRSVLKYTGTGALSSTAYAATASAQTGPTVNIRQVNRPDFPGVTVFATVQDSGGSSITNLSKSDFTLTETRLGPSSTQAIDTLLQPEKDVAGNIATSIVIDQSGSMGTGTRMQEAIQGGKNFVQQFGSGDQGLLVAFDDTINIPQRWTDTQSDLTNAIDNLSPDGSTALFDAVKKGLNEADPRTDRSDIGRSAVVVLADGQDNASSASATEVINTANQQNIPIYTIGLGSTVNATNLERLASETGGEYYRSADGSDLTAIYNEISDSITSEYQITYITNDDTTDGEQREIRLETSYNGQTVFDTETYEEPCAPLPTASFDLSPGAVVEGQEVSFDGRSSQPNGGNLVSYEWDFNNDGSIDATGETATNTYTQPGQYDVALTVEKTCGARDVEVKSLAVADEPVSVVNIDTNDPIQAGEVLEVELELKNAEFDKENRSVTLQDFNGNTVDAEAVQVGRGETLNITLEWNTEAGDGGTNDITVRVSDIVVTEEVEIEESLSAISIENPRLVQQVENTRIDDTPNGDLGGVDRIIGDAPQNDGTPDPPLVENSQTTTIFGINTVSWDVSEDNKPVDVTVTRQFSSGTSNSDSFKLPPETVAEGDIISRIGGISDRPDIDSFSDVIIENPNTYPVFELDEEIESVSINVEPADSSVSGDEVTLTRGGGSENDFEARSTPPLNVGFIAVDNSSGLNRPYGQIGADFPSTAGVVTLPQKKRKAAYQDEIRTSVEYMTKVVPTNRINIYRHSIESGVQAEAEDTDIPWLPQVAGDMEEARAQLEQEIDSGNVSTSGGGPANGVLFSIDEDGSRFSPDDLSIDEFDVTIGIVPFRYLNVVSGDPPPQQSNKATFGLHMGDPLLSSTQPRTSAFVIAGASEAANDIGESSSTVVHEAGHHLIGDPFKGELGQDANLIDDGEIDGTDEAHAHVDVVSTKFDISDGNLDQDSIEFSVPSYMSYANKKTWTDSLTTQRLIETDGSFNPTPPEDPGTTNNITGSLFVSGVITDQGIEFTKIKERSRSIGTINSNEGADIKIKDDSGEIISNHSLSTTMIATPSRSGEFSEAGSPIISEDIIIGDIPYPDETSEVEITAEPSESDGQVTSIVSTDDIEEPTIPSPENWYGSYVNQNDVVNDSGLNEAVGDYLGGDLSDSRLNSVISSYLSGDPIN